MEGWRDGGMAERIGLINGWEDGGMDGCPSLRTDGLMVVHEF